MKGSLIVLYGVLGYLFFNGRVPPGHLVCVGHGRVAAPVTSKQSIADQGGLARPVRHAAQRHGAEGLKRAWTKLLPTATERSTYVLFASAPLLALVEFWQPLRSKPYNPPTLQTPGPYRWVPAQSVGHLFFAVMCTAYILLAIQLGERDLITFHGEVYGTYRSGVSMLVPWPRRRNPATTRAQKGAA